MKRLLALLLLATLLLTACASPNPPLDNETTEAPTDAESTTPDDNETTTPAECETTMPAEVETTTPADTETTAPDETGTTILDDSITDPPSVNLAQRVQSVEILNDEGEVVTITLGMKAGEYENLLPNSMILPYGFGFHFNTKNQGVVVIIDATDIYNVFISEILIFPERNSDPTDEDFHNLTNGMLLEEVVWAVGIPNYVMIGGAGYYAFYKTDSEITYQLIYSIVDQKQIVYLGYWENLPVD